MDAPTAGPEDAGDDVAVDPAAAPAGHLVAEHGQEDPEHSASLTTTLLLKRLAHQRGAAKLD
eukprot:2485968-Prorocentrum_lima.AAC.1